jgi:hypothetical protein
MSPKTPRADARLQEWITARQRHHLSHTHVQMARELSMNPRKLGKLDNADQEPWKLPLPGFIEAFPKALRQGSPRSGALHRGASSSFGAEERCPARDKPAEA